MTPPVATGWTVALNLPVASERFGFDYDDAAAVAAQERRIEALVRRYRDHPALLCWILGNELDFNYTNPRVYERCQRPLAAGPPPGSEPSHHHPR